MPFNSLDEIYQALLKGKKVKNIYWPDGRFIHLVDGRMRDDKTRSRTFGFAQPEHWQIAEEPKHYLTTLDLTNIKVVKIHYPSYVEPAKEGTYKIEPYNNGFTVAVVMAIDLALRNGWKVEVLE